MDTTRDPVSKGGQDKYPWPRQASLEQGGCVILKVPFLSLFITESQVTPSCSKETYWVCLFGVNFSMCEPSPQKGGEDVPIALSICGSLVSHLSVFFSELTSGSA